MTKIKKIIENPPYLDDEEKEAIEAFHTSTGANSDLTEERKSQLKASTQATINSPKKPITTRLSELDFSRLKARAMEKGIGYQTLLASIVHQYVEGTLTEDK